MRIEGMSGLSLYEALQLAVSMIRHRARTSIVEASTGLHGDAIRTLFKDIHGSSPSSGPLLTSAEPLTRKPYRHLHAAIFAALYGDFRHSSEGIDADAVVRAFELYLELAPKDRHRIDINEAWIVARDLRAGLVSTRRCHRCRIIYLVAVAAKRPPACPVCTIQRRAATKSARRPPQ